MYDGGTFWICRASRLAKLDGITVAQFMGDQTSIQQMNMGLEEDEVRQWLLGFDAATLKHGM